MSEPVSFSVFQERALYDPASGFFEQGRGAGRDADFITSPELGTVFAECLMTGVDRWWRKAGRPTEFVFIEAGAGRGTLAKAMLEVEGCECAESLRYITVERSQELRHQQSVTLGDSVEICSDLPSRHSNKPGIVFANELLDNIPCDVYEYTKLGWHEVLVPEAFVRAPRPVVDLLDALVAQPLAGQRVPLQTKTRNWVERACRTLGEGRLIAVDYTDTTPSMAKQHHSEWLRTYRRHGFGGNAFGQPGACDITCEVAIDQLPAPDRLLDQACFLQELGIEKIAADDAERANTADIAGLVAKSRTNEAMALTDLSGLGAFTVMEWATTGSRR